MIRLFFQVENAHWFYLDFYCKDNSSLKAVGIKEFSSQSESLSVSLSVCLSVCLKCKT